MNPPVHPEYAAAGSFEHLKLGALPPRDDARTLMLAHYLDDAAVLPLIPPTFDLLSPHVVSWPMYRNDALADCTFACAGHLIQGWSAIAGAPKTPTDAAIETAYWETGSPPAAHGVPGGPTDNGRVELAVLNYWRKTGIGADKIGAYVRVDPSNHVHLRAALYLFGGLYTGVALPVTAQTQHVWSVVGDGQHGSSAPGSWGSHAVPWLPRWDGKTVHLVTWGAVLAATLGFSDAYTQEVYAILSKDWFMPGGKLTATGLNVAQLTADLKAVSA